eukprot:m.106018 g.106018  ORF g.106018 m.106018 type:complete len:657 (-) comp15805_c3_seq1:2140-4110(-)
MQRDSITSPRASMALRSTDEKQQVKQAADEDVDVEKAASKHAEAMQPMLEGELQEEDLKLLQEQQQQLLHQAIDCDDNVPLSRIYLGAMGHEKSRSVSLWRTEAALLVLEFLQMYAVIFAIAESRDAWPVQWINMSYFVYIFNMDLWGLMRHMNGFKGNDAPVLSSVVGISYAPYVWIWMMLGPAALLMTYLLKRWFWKRSDILKSVRRQIKMKRILFTVAQVLFLPYATVIARLAHCVDAVDGSGVGAATISVMDVDNTAKCMSAKHLIQLLPGVVIGIPMLIYTARKIHVAVRRQLYTVDPRSHEQFLQMKEHEYMNRMDMTWSWGQYHLFTAYLRSNVHFKTYMCLIKGTLAALFMLLSKMSSTQMSVITLLWLACLSWLLRHHVYRISRCWLPLFVFTLALAVDSGLLFLVLMGTENAMLQHPNLTNELFVTNVVPLIGALLFYVVMHFQDKGVCCFTRKPVWPRTFIMSQSMLDPEALRWRRTMNRARELLAKAWMQPVLLVPVQQLRELIREVRICADEAAAAEHVFEQPLLDLLDELVQEHNRAVNASLFAYKRSCDPRTAATLQELIPAFQKHLHKRDYDLILLSRKKRAILLKLLCMKTLLEPLRRSRAAAAANTAAAAETAAPTEAAVQVLKETSSSSNLLASSNA